jgi:hypothetical protein
VRSWRRPGRPPGRAAGQASGAIDETRGTVRVRSRHVLVAALIVGVSATSIAVAVTGLPDGTSTAMRPPVPEVIHPRGAASPAAIAPVPVPLGSSGAGLPSTAPTALFVGASYTAGLGAQPVTDGYAYDTARLLGWRAEIDGASGTSYLNPGHHGAGTYPSRISRVSLRVAPAVIVIQSGRNDLGSPLTAIHQAVLSTLSLTTHRWPDARLVVLGAIPATVPVSPALIGLEGVLRSACATAGVTFIDPIAQNWITASNERPNAGLVPAHPGNAGYAYLASRLAADLTGLLPPALIHAPAQP